MSTRYEFIALRRLNAVAQQSRKLHMTGPATYPSKFLASKPMVSRQELDGKSADKANAANGRSFNTSRELKRNKDSSTMDFAFFPNTEASEQADGMRMLRFDASAHNKAPVDAQLSSVAKPEISTTSLDSHISPMSDVHDNTAVDIDFHTVTEQVNKAASMASGAVKTEHNNAAPKAQAGSGALKSLWSGMMEDFVGPSRPSMQKPAH